MKNEEHTQKINDDVDCIDESLVSAGIDVDLIARLSLPLAGGKERKNDATQKRRRR